LGLQTNNGQQYRLRSDRASSSWQIKKEKRDCARVRDKFFFLVVVVSNQKYDKKS